MTEKQTFRLSPSALNLMKECPRYKEVIKYFTDELD